MSNFIDKHTKQGFELVIVKAFLAPNCMRSTICTLTAIFLIFFGLYAQNAPDCRTAIPVCADAPILGFADGSGDIDDFDPESNSIL